MLIYFAETISKTEFDGLIDSNDAVVLQYYLQFVENSWVDREEPQSVKIDLNEKSLLRQKTTQTFKVDKQGVRITIKVQEHPPTLVFFIIFWEVCNGESNLGLPEP